MKKIFRAMECCVALSLLGTALAANPNPPNLTGTWRMDASASRVSKDWPANTVLIIRQFGNRVEMDRRAGDRDLVNGAYIADGTQRPLYTSRTERAYLTADWEHDNLVIRIRRVQWSEIGDMPAAVDVDRWSLADQGRTLIRKSSDGKVLTFHKQEEKKAATPENKPPAPSKPQ